MGRLTTRDYKNRIGLLGKEKVFDRRCFNVIDIRNRIEGEKLLVQAFEKLEYYENLEKTGMGVGLFTKNEEAKTLKKIVQDIENEIFISKDIGRKQCEGMARAIAIIRKYIGEEGRD